MIDNNEFIRTTVWLPIKLHREAKLLALLADTSLSNLARLAISDKVKQMKEQNINKNENVSKNSVPSVPKRK